MRSAIEAHGGRERLARLDNVKLVGRGRFKGQLDLTGTVSFVAPSTFAVKAAVGGRTAMEFGMNGDRCWRRTRHLVRPCSAEDEVQQRQFGEVLRLRLLHGLEGRSLRSAGYRTVGGVSAPAVRVGDLVLAFDPQSHRLLEISSGNWTDIYSDFRPVDGVLVAATRTHLIGGELDVEETWEEILPGQADTKELAPPPPAADGQTLDAVDAERWVATTEVGDLAAQVVAALHALDQFARDNGQTVSASEGYILTEPAAGGTSGWEISIGLEPTTAGLPTVADGPFRFERWPEARFVGVFHRGDWGAEAGERAVLQRLMEDGGVRAAPGSRRQIVCTRESLEEPPENRLCLIRVLVEGAPAPAS